jgi:two-component system cell cycle sensor histidine kinase/response regulator CckA
MNVPDNAAQKYLDIAGTIILVIKPDETVELINKHGCDILGYGSKEIVGLNWFENFLPHEQRDKVRRVFRQIINGEVNPQENFENSIMTREGEKRVIAWKNSLIVGEDGKIQGTLSSGQDVTERIKMEQVLRESEERYRLLFENNPHPMLVYDLETLRILDVNEAALDQYGYSRKEFLDLTILDIRPAEDIPALMENVAAVTNGLDHAGEWRHRRKDGTIIDVEINSHTLMYQGSQAEVVLAYDITRRKQVENDLRESEQKYRSFFEEDLTGDYISSPDGRLLFCNQAFLSIFGFKSLEQAQSVQIQSLYRHASDRQKLLNLLKTKKKLENYEMQLQKIDGTPIFVMANIIGKFDTGGVLIETKGYLYDISRHKKTEEQFWLAQKMEAVGRLAGGVAHDFNNLLSVINGYSDLSRHKLAENHPLQRNLYMIYQAGKKAEALTRQLLAFSRRQVMQPRVINLNNLVDDLEKMLKRLIGEDITLSTRKESELGFVKADPTQMEQVLMNLAVNSRDAMPEGGQMIIETRNVTFSEDQVHERVTMSAGEYVLLAVSDTGVGMDSDTQAQIFEPFFTTKEKGKGTGLGLSTVYGIIKQSGGFIWVYSEAGKGTSFKIYLPRSEEQIESEVPVKRQPETLQGSESILLVEDDEAVLSIGELILERSGYTVLTATNGDAALKLVNKVNHNVDLIVTDVVMPGMSGKELADRIKAMIPEIPVLYLSGYTDDAIAQHGILDSGVEFLPKPFDREELLLKVREILDGASDKF